MTESESPQASATAKPPLKRPLFTKPSWAQQDNSVSSTDFFRRSNQCYQQIAAEEERKRQRKLAKKRSEQVRENAETTRKRQRIDSDSDSATESDRSKNVGDMQNQGDPTQCIASPSVIQVAKTKRSSSPPKPKSSPKSLSKRYETATTAENKNADHKPLSSNIIDLEDEDEDELPRVHAEDIVEVNTTKRPEPVEDGDDFPPSDDEYAELARKAREKARRKRLEADAPRITSQHDRSHRAGSFHEPTPPAAPADPVVSILITSRIPNTDPLIVNRRVSQRLKDVRVTWCQRQGFTPETADTVFLAWRGKRLFDVTTCRSLGIGVDSQGNVVTKGQKDILGEDERQVHIEATTEEIQAEFQRAKQREAKEKDLDETQAQEAVAAETKEPQVRIILKAKGFDDFKLIVKSVSCFFMMEAKGKDSTDQCPSDNPYIKDCECLQVGQEGRRRSGGLSIF